MCGAVRLEIEWSMCFSSLYFYIYATDIFRRSIPKLNGQQTVSTVGARKCKLLILPGSTATYYVHRNQTLNYNITNVKYSWRPISDLIEWKIYNFQQANVCSECRWRRTYIRTPYTWISNIVRCRIAPAHSVQCSRSVFIMIARVVFCFSSNLFRQYGHPIHDAAPAQADPEPIR